MMNTEIKVITSYESFLQYMDDYIPLLADYLTWNFEGRYHHNSKMFIDESGNIPSLQEVLQPIHTILMTNTLSNEWDEKLQRDFKAGLWFCLAFVDDKIAGMMRLLSQNKKETELHSVYVDPKFRGKQIGTKLIEKLIDIARQNGIEVIYLDTMPFMTHAIKLYESVGFEYVDFIAFPKYTRENAKEFQTVFMELKL